MPHPDKNERLLALVEELDDIKDGFLELVERAEAALRDAPESARARAQCYWVAHIRTAIDREHSYLGGSLVTMDETIEEISARVYERAHE
jgi:hypothetical protein